MGTTVKGSNDLLSSADWKAMESHFLATGHAGTLQKGLTEARSLAAIHAYHASIEKSFPQRVLLLAAGALGRGEMFPYSELDVVVLLESTEHANGVKELASEFVRL